MPDMVLFHGKWNMRLSQLLALERSLAACLLSSAAKAAATSFLYSGTDATVTSKAAGFPLSQELT